MFKVPEIPVIYRREDHPEDLLMEEKTSNKPLYFKKFIKHPVVIRGILETLPLYHFKHMCSVAC